MLEAPDAEAAHLDQPGQRLSRTRQQPPVRGRKLNPIIADQAGETNEPAFRGLDESQS
jgi:hypothetical protein